MEMKRPMERFLALGTLLAVVTAPSSVAQIQLSSEGEDPVAAYNASLGEYFVVWTRVNLSASLSGRRVALNGALLGAERYLGPGAANFLTSAHDASVAPVQTGSARWVVAALSSRNETHPAYITVDSQGRPLSNVLLLEPNLAVTSYTIDVGGEATALDDDVIVVYDRRDPSATPVGAIVAVELHPDSLSVLKTEILAEGSDVGTVSIASTGGLPGRYLITWTQGPSLGTDVYGAVVDRDLNVLVPAFPIARSAAVERHPQVDGDGTNWVVTYRRDDDVACRQVAYDPQTVSVSVSASATVYSGPVSNIMRPAVLWNDESCLVGYRKRSTVNRDLVVESLETFGCRPCEGAFPIAQNVSKAGFFTSDLGMAAVPGGDRGILVWEDGFSFGAVWLQVYSTDDGDVRDLGGGCGQGGVASATCAAVGTSSFGVRVQQAAPASAGWLMLGPSAANFACGPCTLVPVPVVAVPVSLDSVGTAQVTLSVPANPSLRGAALLAQWLVTAPGGCAPLGASFSNALSITIE